MPETRATPGDAPSALDALGWHHRRIAATLRDLEALAADAAKGDIPGLPARVPPVVTAIDEDLGVHIDDEEQDIFPAVLAASGSPARTSQAFALVAALLVEHRELAEQWHELRVRLLAAAGGLAAPFPVAPARDFAQRLRVHAEREDFELAELVRLLDPERARHVAAAIAARHRQT